MTLCDVYVGIENNDIVRNHVGKVIGQAESWKYIECRLHLQLSENMDSNDDLIHRLVTGLDVSLSGEVNAEEEASDPYDDMVQNLGPGTSRAATAPAPRRNIPSSVSSLTVTRSKPSSAPESSSQDGVEEILSKPAKRQKTSTMTVAEGLKKLQNLDALAAEDLSWEDLGKLRSLKEIVGNVKSKDKDDDREDVQVVKIEGKLKVTYANNKTKEIDINEDGITNCSLLARHFLRVPNSSPASWWTRVDGTETSYPVRGESLHLTPVMGASRINDKVLKMMHKRSSHLHHKMFLTRNSCSDHQSKLVMVADDNSSAKIGSRYAEASSVFEIVEGVLNFDGGLHSIRNYSYESRAIIR